MAATKHAHVRVCGERGSAVIHEFLDAAGPGKAHANV
jgi:hypothetical protein